LLDRAQRIAESAVISAAVVPSLNPRAPDAAWGAASAIAANAATAAVTAVLLTGA
jgi:hypothetical protein